MEAYDNIVFQFPVQWFNCPPLLKQWFDDVLTFGWAYGPDGIALRGKKVGLAVSFGQPAASYSPTETKYAGLTLRTPLIIGSSGLTSKVERNKAFEEAGAGAIVLKSMFEEQIEAQSDALMQGADDYPEAADYVRHYVKANQSEEYLTLIRETKTQCTIPIIASVNCYKADTWVDFARQIEAAGADALELNVFYFCTDLHTTGQEVVDVYTSILKQVKKQISIPLIMKIGKGFSNIPAVVNLLKGHGADGVVLFNRFFFQDLNTCCL